MTKTKIIDVKSGKEQIVKVLSKTNKFLKIVLNGTQIIVLLTRKDVNKRYYGKFHEIEFVSNGQEI